MEVIRVLYLDIEATQYLPRLESEAGCKVESMRLNQSEMMEGFHYVVMQFGRDLAQRAAPAEYDCVVIGDNKGTGLDYARRIPDEMKSKTLIVWDKYDPGVEAKYAEMGFEHFCRRDAQVDYLRRMLDVGLPELANH